MFMNVIVLLLFFVPVVALLWRIVVSKTRSHWLRVGAAGAAMATAVGALVVYDELSDFSFKDWREDVALLASMSGSAYLLGWAQRHHGDKRHRTISVIAAIVGLVPIAGALLTGLLFGEH